MLNQTIFSAFKNDFTMVVDEYQITCTIDGFWIRVIQGSEQRQQLSFLDYCSTSWLKDVPLTQSSPSLLASIILLFPIVKNENISITECFANW